MRIRPLPVLLLAAFGAAATAQELSYSALTEGQTVSGFRATAVYTDESDSAIGARFRHEASGFTVDLVRIQTVPQAFIWVTTYPTSNMGEPHTQEHLLLGKGNQGRALNSKETMSLVTSNAFTMQHETCYDFLTPAGPDVFFRHFEQTMDALLHPDYTDEEVHREVRNFGIGANAKDGSLHLEEKGSVYAEMVTSMDQADDLLWRDASVTVYGPEHPLSFESGGLPAALRVITPADIHRFHAQHYFLANMGAVISLPKEVSPADALGQLDAALQRLDPRKPDLPVMTAAQLPKPQPAPAGRIQYVEYPFRNQEQPGSVMLLWPADRSLDSREQILAELFLGAMASGPDSNLYRLLVDSRSRDAAFDAKDVGFLMQDDPGHPIALLFSDVASRHMNDVEMAKLRTTVMDEFARVAALPDGSPELAKFNAQVKGRLAEERRQLAKFVNSPPGFGLRNTGSDWMDHLKRLNQEPGFRKSLTERETLAQLDALLDGAANLWLDRLVRWKILGVMPWVEAAKPNAALVEKEQKERETRATSEVARLRQLYGVSSGQEAIRRYQADYDAAGAVIEQAAKSLKMPTFVDHPPMTLDDQIDYRQEVVGGVPLVSTTFDSMSSATTSLLLRLDAVPPNRLVYLSILPALLTQVGVIENGAPVSYERMTERLRTEILSLDARFTSNATRGRFEIGIYGAGNNAAEARRAIEWMKLALLHPDWRVENLPRIRDLVDQRLDSLRNTMQDAEEAWTDNPARAYLLQANPLALATGSFLARAHGVWRLRWMLKNGGSPPVYAFLAALAKTTGTRAQREGVLKAIEDGKHPALAPLGAPARQLAKDAARDLQAMLADIPDSSLAADWSALCAEMASGLRAGPRETLARLEEVRQMLLPTGGARMTTVGSAAIQRELRPEIESLAGVLRQAPLAKAAYPSARIIDRRLRDRDSAAVRPVFVGLLNPNSQGGVLLNSVPAATYWTTDREQLLTYLAGNLFGGAATHSLYLKTWGAGLAYGNGARTDLGAGRFSYYADRTPELPQTLKFVIDTVRNTAPDKGFGDYCVALAFRAGRSQISYEERADGIAADLADGLTPQVVSRFRQAILDLRATPGLSGELFRRAQTRYGQILPGMGVPAKDVAGAVYMVIGPEKQIAAYEEYLKRSDAPGDRVWRLYARDFWMVDR